MAVNLSHFTTLILGFVFGMFFMYNVVPIRTNEHLQSGLRPRSINEVLRFGHPGPIADLLERTSYTVSYNRKDRIPHWVGEHLTKENLRNTGSSRDDSSFTEDTSVPVMFRVNTRDYTNSGFDRGHMSPAADAYRSQQAMDETFLMTNIAPQVGVGFNRQYWAYLEQFCRSLTNNFTDVYVYSGPLFLPTLVNSTSSTASVSVALDQVKNFKRAQVSANYQVQYRVIGDTTPKVSVPTHFYKVLLVALGSGKYALGAFVLPNQAIQSKTPLTNFQVKLDAIEKASGLTFFESLTRTSLVDLCTKTKCSV